MIIKFSEFFGDIQPGCEAAYGNDLEVIAGGGTIYLYNKRSRMAALAYRVPDGTNYSNVSFDAKGVTIDNGDRESGEYFLDLKTGTVSRLTDAETSKLKAGTVCD